MFPAISYQALQNTSSGQISFIFHVYLYLDISIFQNISCAYNAPSNRTKSISVRVMVYFCSQMNRNCSPEFLSFSWYEIWKVYILRIIIATIPIVKYNTNYILTFVGARSFHFNTNFHAFPLHSRAKHGVTGCVRYLGNNSRTT